MSDSVFNRSYDIILPLGEGCPTAMMLKYCGMRFSSSPFDWLKVGNLQAQAEILSSRFKCFMELGDLVLSPAQTNPKNKVVSNRRWNYASHHDFSRERSIEESYPEVRSKYERRIKRLLSALDEGCSTLLCWIDYPFQTSEISRDSIMESLERIQAAYPKSSFALVYIHNSDKHQAPLTEMLSPHITKITAAYNAHDYVRPWRIKYERLAYLLSRIKLSSRYADVKSYRQYTRMLSNIGTSEKRYIRRCDFANNFTDLILKSRFVWRLARVIYKLFRKQALHLF